VSGESLVIKADTIQLSSGVNVSTFDGLYSSLTGTPTLFSGSWNDLTDTPSFVNLTLNGSTYSPIGTSVSLTTEELGVTSAYLAGKDALVFGQTSIQGGRIKLLSSGRLDADTTSSSTTLDTSAIEINAHTQQIIISDSS
jgi:hypothetical protein